MKNRNVINTFIMTALACVSFIACKNAVMEKWWDDREPEYIEIIKEVPASINDPNQVEGKFFTVAFETNGGDPVPEAQKIAAGGLLAKIEAVRNGDLGFGGWYTDPEFNFLWDFATRKVDQDYILYAQWDTSSYLVQFEDSAQTTYAESQQLAAGAKIIEPVSKLLTKEGYAFSGWYTPGTPPDGKAWNFATDTVTGNMTLEPRWTEIHLTVTFDERCASVVSDQNIVYGRTIVEPEAITKDGFGFGGWYRDISLQYRWNFATDKVIENITLYAKWDTNRCTVTFDANGGNITPPAQEIAIGGRVINVSPGEKEELGFAGWYGENESEWNFSTDTVTSSITLHANWVDNSRTVTFKKNNNEADTLFKVETGRTIIEPKSPENAGYVFAGWYKDEFYTDDWNFATDNITSDTILYAKWTAEVKHYTVIFYPRGGNVVPDPMVIGYGGFITEPASVTRDGFGFGGWYTDENYTNQWDFAHPVTDSIKNINTENGSIISLYAKWVLMIHTVTFEANGGKPVPPAQRIGYDGYVAKTEAMSNSDKGFGGWYSDKGFAGNAWSFASSVVRSDITLYAKWDTNRFQITFISKDKTVSIRQIASGSTISDPPTVTEPGSDFAGWYTDNTFTEEWNFDTNKVTEAKTLYAKWTDMQRTVTFDAQGGSGVAPQSIAYGRYVTEPNPIPTKDAHGFGGWYTDESLIYRWDFATDKVTKNITLYAKWDTTRYTVTFDARGGDATPPDQIIAVNGKAVKVSPGQNGDQGFAGWYRDEDCTDDWDFAVDTVTQNTPLYAKWVAEAFTVTFKKGNGEADATLKLAKDAKAIEPSVTNSGKVLAGWYTDENFSPSTQWDFVTSRVNASITLYAKWLDEVKYSEVIFYPLATTAVPATQNVADGGKIAEPVSLTRTGYSFGGWYTGIDNEVNPDFTNDRAERWNFTTPVDAVTNPVIKLFANWVQIVYTVQFEENGGYPLQENQTVAAGNRIGKVQNMVNVNNNLGFIGWYTDAACTQAWDIMADTVNSNITLYAKWTKPTYTVEFIHGDNGQKAAEPQQILEGAKVTEPDVIIRIGQGFGGWYKDSKFADDWDFATDTVTSNTTIYAKWTDISYTVTFNAQGGNPIPAAQGVAYNGTVTEPSAISRADYGFGGWYLDKNLNGKLDDDGTDMLWNFATALNETTTSSTTITLYAKWVIRYYTVTFDVNGGTPAPDPATITVSSGSKLDRPAVITQTQRSFSGWYADQSSAAWDFDMNTVNSDITLTAQWGEPHYKVVFNPRGGNLDTDQDGSPGEAEDLTQALQIGTKVQPPPRPANTAYPDWDFDGWYPNTNFNVAEVWDFDTTITETMTADPALFNGDTMTLHAKWVKRVPGLNIVWVPGGSSAIGDSTVSGAGPERKVRLNGFYIMPFEVTQDMYFDLTGYDPKIGTVNKAQGKDPSQFGTETNKDTRPGVEVDRPVERVSWYDAVQSCNYLTDMANDLMAAHGYGRPMQRAYEVTNIVYKDIQGTGTPAKQSIASATVTFNKNANGFRLPTEAEWEYAADGGDGSPGKYVYSGSNSIDEVAWFNDNAKETHTVEGKKPNALGLYDMNGNVSEWCWDWYAPYSNSYYKSPEGLVNPTGPSAGTTTPQRKIRRGGNWNTIAGNTTNVARGDTAREVPDATSWTVGYRMVCGPLGSDYGTYPWEAEQSASSARLSARRLLQNAQPFTVFNWNNGN